MNNSVCGKGNHGDLDSLSRIQTKDPMRLKGSSNRQVLLQMMRRVGIAGATFCLACSPTVFSQAAAASTAVPTGPYSSASMVLAQEGASASLACEKALYPMVKDDRSVPAQWVDPTSLTFGVGDAAKTVSPVDVGPIMANQDVWMIQSAQMNGVPWLGANTQHETFATETTGDVTLEVNSFTGPGDLVVAEGGALGQVFGTEWFRVEGGVGSGSHTIGANTHVHPNWIFSSPGEYQVGIKQTATLNDGNTVEGSTVLYFNVGGAGNADEGHFDLGPAIGCAGSSPAGEETSAASTNENSSGTSAGGTGSSGQGSAGNSSAQGAGGKSAGNAGSLAVTGFEPLNVVIAVFALGLAVMGAGVIYRSRREN